MRERKIEVHLYGRLRRAGEEGDGTRLSVTVQAEETIGDVLSRIGIKPEEVSHLFLNFQYSALGRTVKEGDRLAVFPREMGLLYRQYFPIVE